MFKTFKSDVYLHCEKDRFEDKKIRKIYIPITDTGFTIKLNCTNIDENYLEVIADTFYPYSNEVRPHLGFVKDSYLNTLEHYGTYNIEKL